MTPSRAPARVFALALLALSCASGAAGVVFSILVGSTADTTFAAGQAVLAVGYPAVGVLVANRHPRNPCAWILIAVGLFQGISAGGFAYAEFSNESMRRLPAAATLQWVSNWIWFPSLALLITFLLLLFPNGRLPSRRWRPLAGITGIFIAAGTATSGYFAAMPPESDGGEGAWQGVLFACLLVLGLLSAASVVVRFRRSRGVERQQLKWIALGGVGVVAGVWLTFWSDAFVGVLWVCIVLMLGFPASIGVAILRFRLFDIDRIISRAVSYALLTALLLLVYATGIVALRPLLEPVVGKSQLAIAASTIAAAAVFQPARRRIQSTVDGRFNRARYDAARVVEEFTTQLRMQVDLDELTTQLNTAVQQTVQPARVSVWLNRHTVA